MMVSSNKEHIKNLLKILQDDESPKKENKFNKNFNQGLIESSPEASNNARVKNFQNKNDFNTEIKNMISSNFNKHSEMMNEKMMIVMEAIYDFGQEIIKLKKKNAELEEKNTMLMAFVKAYLTENLNGVADLEPNKDKNFKDSPKAQNSKSPGKKVKDYKKKEEKKILNSITFTKSKGTGDAFNNYLSDEDEFVFKDVELVFPIYADPKAKKSNNLFESRGAKPKIKHTNVQVVDLCVYSSDEDLYIDDNSDEFVVPTFDFNLQKSNKNFESGGAKPKIKPAHVSNF